MVKAEFRYFSRGTDLQKLATAKRTNGFLADNQIWEAQGPRFSEIYVCKSPQGGEGGSTGPAVYSVSHLILSLRLNDAVIMPSLSGHHAGKLISHLSQSLCTL